MRPVVKNILKKTIGVILVIIGFLALVTPLTPGSWLMLVGFQMLGWGFLLENRVVRAIRKKFENPKRKSTKDSTQDTERRLS